ncbi:hypothetical protein [Rhodococcus pyridinivorans]|uniref:hypothetical protein n=1 Tax=Rhodococcus pyridinivorans TaxID=103816 RepID=UPI003AAB5DA9
MTTPGESAPDGAWQYGTSFGQGMDEASVMEATTGAARANLLEAVSKYALHLQQQNATRADLMDGQNGLKPRVELLSDVSGYGTAVMGYNWDLPHSTWCVIPFDTQLGPTKGVSVVAPQMGSGYLTLKRGGLWRVDAQFAVTGMSIGLTYFWSGGAPGQGVLLPMNTYSPIFPKVMFEVLDATGNLISAQQFDMVSDLQLNAQGLGYQNAPRSGAFSKTFVVEEMPGEDDPAAPDHWVHVRMSIRYSPIYTGQLNATTCKVLGGTKYSALSATRWSRDASHINYADEVPDGGDLG